MTTRDKLIETTQELLWERGYVGSSPRAILERSGVGQGSLYHHFAGKADLALAAVERSAASLCEAAERCFAAPGTAAERVTRWLERERDVLRGCPIGRLTQDPEVVSSPALRRPVEEAMAWLTDRVTAVLVEGQERGDLDSALDARDVAAALVAVLQGGYVLARAAASPEPSTRAVSGALALLGAFARPGRD